MSEEHKGVLTQEQAEVLVKKLEQTRDEINEGRELSKKAQEEMTNDLSAVVKTHKSLADEVEAKEKRIKGLEDQYEVLEKQMRRPAFGDEKAIRKAAFESVEKALLHGERQEKVLATDSNVDGGFLVAPADFVLEIDKDITEITPVLGAGGVRVRNTNRNEVVVNRRITRPATEAVGERGTFPNSQSSYGRVTIKVHKQAVETSITREDLMDSAFNMESEIIADVNEDFAQKIGAQIIKGGGDGVNEANGILKNADILANGVTPSGVSGGLGDYKKIIEFLGTLKTGYNKSLWMNRTVLSEIWQLEDGAGRPIFNAGDFAKAQGPSIQGIPVVEAPDMPELAADALVIAYGDFNRCYMFVQHTELMMIRDEITQAREDIINFTFRRRYGGDVIRSEAIKLYRAAV